MSPSSEVVSEMESSRKRGRDDALEDEDVVSHKKLKLMVKKGRWELETNRQTLQKLVSKNTEIRDDLIAEMDETMDNLQKILKEQTIEAETLKIILKEKNNLITNLDLRQNKERKNLAKLVREIENKARAMEEFEESFKRKHPDLVEFLETMKIQQQKIVKLETSLNAKNLEKKRLAAIEKNAKTAPIVDLKKILNGLNVTISSASEENKNNGGNPKITVSKDNYNPSKIETKRNASNLNVDDNLSNILREKRAGDLSRKEPPIAKSVIREITKPEGGSNNQNKTGKISAPNSREETKYVAPESLECKVSCSSCLLGRVHMCLEDDFLDEEDPELNIAS